MYRRPLIRRSQSLSVGGGFGGLLPFSLLHSTSILRPSFVSSVQRLVVALSRGFSTMCPGGNGGRMETAP
jgi:hypothetical protein